VSPGGVPYIYAYKHLAAGDGDNKGWFMTAIVGIPEARALEKPRRILVQHVGGLILVAALALAGAWLFARRAILDPLTALTLAAERVKDGDATARTGIRIGGELGALARDFDDMAEALARREQERDAAKKELERQYAFVSTLVEAAPLPIYHKDRSGRFVGCNRAFADFVGKDEGQIIGCTTGDILAPAPSDQNTASDEEIMARGESLVSETTARAASGGERQMFFHKAAYRDDTGEVAGLVGILVDITPLKTAQAELVAAKEKAEEASRIKSDFLASMSHEIRTPLNGVLGMLQILLAEVVEPRHREYLDAAMGAARSLLQIIGEVLDFSKIEAGRLEMSVKDFRTADLLESVKGLFGVQTETRGLSLSCELSPDVPAWVRGDEQRLKQILFNLVGNALKFTDTGGVRVRVARVAAEEAPDETVLDLIVEDTGVGIAVESQTRIFEPFRQAGDSFERRSQGTGLGLVIVRRLAEAMGGFVHLYSREGEGTRFTVRVRLGRSAMTDSDSQAETAQDRAVGPGEGRRPLPAIPPLGEADAGQEGARENNVAGDVAGLRVLVVEDDHLNRLTAVKLLERLGCVAEGVPGGEEALSLLDVKTFDAVLMDIQMPGMDGMETTRRIRNSGRAEVSGLFVAAVTAHALKGDREVFLRAGMDDYLSKPVDMDELSAMLVRAMQRRISS
jgi:PAS domain S-box-containing protein